MTPMVTAIRGGVMLLVLFNGEVRTSSEGQVDAPEGVGETRETPRPWGTLALSSAAKRAIVWRTKGSSRSCGDRMTQMHMKLNARSGEHRTLLILGRV